MRYKRKRAAACSGSDGEDEILPSQHRKRAIDAMEGRLANLAGEVSALQSQLEDLRKLHGELAAEGDILQARLQGLPQEATLVNRPSDGHAPGSRSTRGSDPGSTFHFSMLTAAEPASPGGHGSAERQHPHAKTCRTAPDVRSADDQHDQLAHVHPLPVDFWDEIMMPNYHEEYPEAEVAASSEGLLQVAAGSTTGSPAAGVNPNGNASANTPAAASAISSVSRVPSLCAAMAVVPVTPGGGDGAAYLPSATPSNAVMAMGGIAAGTGLLPKLTQGGYPQAAAAGALGELPMGMTGSGGEAGPGPCAVPGVDSFWWHQQQHQLHQQQHQLHQQQLQLQQQLQPEFMRHYMEPLSYQELQPSPAHPGAQRTLYPHGTPTSAMGAAVTSLAVAAAATAAGSQVTSPLPLRFRQSQQQQQQQQQQLLQLPLQQQQQPQLSPHMLGDATPRRPGRWGTWASESCPADAAPLLGRGSTAAAAVSGDSAPAGDHKVSVSDALTAAAAVGSAADEIALSAAGPWLGASTGGGPTPPSLTHTSATPATPRTSMATAAVPIGTFTDSARDHSGGGGGVAAVSLLGGELNGNLSLASRFAGVAKGPLARGVKGYPAGGGPAAAAAALLHDAGMAPATGMGMGMSMGGGVVALGTSGPIVAAGNIGGGMSACAGVQCLKSAASAESVAALQEQQQQQPQPQRASERSQQHLLLQEQQIQQQQMQLQPPSHIKVESPSQSVGLYDSSGTGVSLRGNIDNTSAGASGLSHGRPPPLGGWPAGGGSSSGPAAAAAVSNPGGTDGAVTARDDVDGTACVGGAVAGQISIGPGRSEHVLTASQQQHLEIWPSGSEVAEKPSGSPCTTVQPSAPGGGGGGSLPDAKGSGSASEGVDDTGRMEGVAATSRSVQVGIRLGNPRCGDGLDGRAEHLPQTQSLDRMLSCSGGGAVSVAAAAAAATVLPLPGHGAPPYGHPWGSPPYGSPLPFTPLTYSSPYPVPIRYGASPVGRPVMWRRMPARPPSLVLPPIPAPGGMTTLLPPPGAAPGCAPLGYPMGSLPPQGVTSPLSGQPPPPQLPEAAADSGSGQVTSTISPPLRAS
ncbi:hypothetical protein VaNZ11_016527 [Volvox africanus]|uniref:BZIP domain-containing protein n=1 Tax=Volvox africanus TaxID=51714 RepID=A0ABQ5SP59_9CHLO|nr:hypothetical protein VaNZ11_016527 [Volvox africanus]